MQTSDKQHVGRELASYGKVMHELFKHWIAVKRWEIIKRTKQLDQQEQFARSVSIRTLAGMKRHLQPEDWQKGQRFYKELDHVDLSSSDDLVIEDVLRRCGVSLN